MSGIENFITKDGSKFYLDLDDWNSQNEIQIEYGDIIKFKHEDKKLIAKVLKPNNKYLGVVELSITNENR